MSDESTPPPSFLASPLGRLILEALVGGRSIAAPIEHKARTEANTSWMERMEQELAPFAEAITRQVREALPAEHPMRDAFEQMADPNHQVGFILQLIGIVGAILPTISGLGAVISRDLVYDLNAVHTTLQLDPIQLADMVERNIIDQGTGAGRAAYSGVSADDFDLLVKDTGEPYGVVDALRLWRQGRIGDDELETVVYYSRVRNQFLPDLKLLAYDSMSPADAIEATLKAVVDQGTGQALFEQGGGLAEQFPTLLAAAGNPIGVQAAINLWNHGLIDEDQVNQVILHSRINPAFEPMAKLLRNKWLSVFEIKEALAAGSVDAKTATQWMLEDGYSADQAAAFTTGIASGKSVKTKQLSESMITELYEAKQIDEPTATEALENLGYTAAEVPMVLKIYDARRAQSLLNKSISRVQAAFLAHRISVNQAKQYLTELEVPSDAVELYVETWEIEAATEVRLLTAAQIGAIAKKGGMTYAQAMQRWEEMGYSSADAALLAFDYGGPTPAGSPASAPLPPTPTPTP